MHFRNRTPLTRRRNHVLRSLTSHNRTASLCTVTLAKLGICTLPTAYKTNSRSNDWRCEYTKKPRDRTPCYVAARGIDSPLGCNASERLIPYFFVFNRSECLHSILFRLYKLRESHLCIRLRHLCENLGRWHTLTLHNAHEVSFLTLVALVPFSLCTECTARACDAVLIRLFCILVCNFVKECESPLSLLRGAVPLPYILNNKFTIFSEPCVRAHLLHTANKLG